MPDAGGKLLSRFRYGVIHPRAHEDLQCGSGQSTLQACAARCQELSTGLGLENYTPEGVEKAIRNYWQCVELLAWEKAGVIIFGGAPISAVLTPPCVVELLPWRPKQPVAKKAGAQFRISDRLLPRASAPPISNEKK